jgi:urease gamma subunit
MAKTILKNTNQEAIVKISGIGAETIDLQTDILAATQALDGATQTVNIVTVEYTGLATSTVTITRNGTTVTSLLSEGHDVVAMGAGWSETTENTSDITVTVGTANAQCYLTLRKVSGYASKVETATFGIYDNPAVVGS